MTIVEGWLMAKTASLIDRVATMLEMYTWGSTNN